MNRFFRRIRKQMLSENKVSKYAIYAFGEIVLVVIGILIALQINNWNQQKLNNIEEKKLILSISEKIKHNKFQYNIGLNRYNEVIRSAENLLAIKFNPHSEINTQHVEHSLHSITKRFLFGKSNKVSIYDEMIGAGQLNLLSSDELRKSITSLKANLQLLESYEDIQTDFVEQYLNPFLNLNTDIISTYVNSSKMDSSAYDKSIAIDYSTFYLETDSISYNQILESKEFSNLLFDLIKHTKTILPIYDRIAININDIETIISASN